VSVGFHVLFLIVLGLATWKGVGLVADDASIREFKVKVVTDRGSGGPEGGFRFPGRAYVDRPDSSGVREDVDKVTDLAGLIAIEPGFKPRPLAMGAGGADVLALRELGRSDVVGVGGSGGDFSGGLGAGRGDRDLPGGGPVGSLWGVGEGQRARSVVYVMDRSGSMGDSFGLLQRELMRAVGSLESDQTFNVIWFNEGPAELLSEQMLSGTIENKRKAFGAIKRVYPSGRTEPVDAIRRGLEFKPDVLFLLSDGDFGEDNAQIMRFIRQANADNGTIINTILFIYDTVGEGERVLRAIAEQNGGTFKHVSERDARS